jgi:single-stranded-DNA-specific exonuclease
MTAIEPFNQLSPTAQQIVADYTRRRGVTSDNFNEHLEPRLKLGGSPLPDIQPFVQRLTHAAQNKERILIYGDYDADGITATSILLRCLRDVAGISPLWSLPHRQYDHYGLDLEKAKSLFARHTPQLLITLDNGTNSTEAIAWLKSQGVDTLVVDHHPLDGATPQAVALVNPKAHGADQDDLCAAGLVLLVGHELARAWNAEARWDRDLAVVLAGLGTVADAVSMTSLNRAVVKAAKGLMQNPNHLANIPGLAVLMADSRQINQRELQFNLIPALNAPGRLGSAEPVVTLLTTADPDTAKKLAAHCRTRNELRKQLQQEMVKQANALARVIVNSHPETAVLVLAEHGWHHGVAGPAASRIAETFQRSAILLAPHEEHIWKGSGRSANGDHLGKWIYHAKSLGLIERGGGHARAVGLAATHAQLAPLQSAGLFLPMPQTDHEPEQEVIGELDQLRAEEWFMVMELLAPFGRGNPLALIRAQDALCLSEPTALIAKDKRQPWAVKAHFKSKSGRVFTAVWRDADAAMKQWRTGAHSDLDLELSTQTKEGRIFYNWSVISCRPREDIKDQASWRHPVALRPPSPMGQLGIQTGVKRGKIKSRL